MSSSRLHAGLPLRYSSDQTRVSAHTCIKLGKSYPDLEMIVPATEEQYSQEASGPIPKFKRKNRMTQILARNSCCARQQQQVARQAQNRSCGATQFSCTRKLHVCTQRRVQLYLMSKVVTHMSIWSRSNKVESEPGYGFSQAANTPELGRNSMAALKSGRGKDT